MLIFSPGNLMRQLQAHCFFPNPTEENSETSGIKFAKFIPHHLIVEEIEKP
jgi:hypothetical protein